MAAYGYAIPRRSTNIVGQLVGQMGKTKPDTECPGLIASIPYQINQMDVQHLTYVIEQTHIHQLEIITAQSAYRIVVGFDKVRQLPLCHIAIL